MRVVVAPDKFKGSLTAAEVADAVASGLLAVALDAEVVRVPIADGGDGTVEAALSRGFTAVPVEATGPTGKPVSATYARHDHQAVVELAGVCGLDLLPDRQPDPLGASTLRLGSGAGTGHYSRRDGHRARHRRECLHRRRRRDGPGSGRSAAR